MNLQISDRLKKILFVIAIVTLIELSGFGFFASLFKLLSSIN